LNFDQNIVLTLNSITKNYAAATALSDVSVSFEKGQVTSIYGPNGAGKSTLVKIICGEEKPDFGTVSYKGHHVNFQNYKEALKSGISYVPQDFGLLNNLTALENVAIALNQLGSDIIYSIRNVENFIADRKQDGLPFPEFNTKVEDLSAYDQQLLATQKALIFSSDLLIFDESTTNINKLGFQEFRKVIKQLKDDGKAIIFISHKLDEVFSISDDVVILKEGKIIKKCKIDKISKDDIIKLFVTNVRPVNKHPWFEEDLLCRIEIENEDLDDIQLSISKGEIITFDTGDTSLNQELGYRFFDFLNKQKSLKVGIIPALRDEEAIFENLSVRDNLIINMIGKSKFRGKRKKETELNTIAEKLKLKFGDWNQSVNELSGGNKQKIVFGRWMLADFNLMILIEPTSGIDIQTKGIIHNTILDLKDDGKSFILLTSDEGEQKMLQTRKISLDQKTRMIC